MVVQITGNTELCSILTEKSRKMLKIEKGDTVWAVFNATTVFHAIDLLGTSQCFPGFKAYGVQGHRGEAQTEGILLIPA